MRRFRWGVLVLVAVLGAATVAAAAETRASSDPPPSLEYRPQRVVIPEPKAPTPMPPKTIFTEAVGSFGIMTGSFDRPVDVVRDAGGNFYVLDAGNNRVQKFDRSANFVISFGSRGSRDGQFNNPSAIAVGYLDDSDEREALYVVDTGNDRIQIYLIKDLVGNPVMPIMPYRVWGSRGSWKGDFKSPRDIAIDSRRNRKKIYVLDSGNERVQRFEPDGKLEGGTTFELRGGKYADMTSIVWSGERLGYLFVLSPGCVVQQFSLGGDAGGSSNDATLVNSFSAVAPESGLCVPSRIRIDQKNNYLYVLDVGNNLLICVNPSVGGMFRWALRRAEVPFSKPFGLAVGSDGEEFLVADTENNIVQKFTLR